MNKLEKYGIEYNYELIDRSHIISQMWSQLIQNNPACENDIELNKLSEEIGEKLGEFYQLAGKIYFDKEKSYAN